MKIAILHTILLLLCLGVVAQERVTISFEIRDTKDNKIITDNGISLHLSGEWEGSDTYNFIAGKAYVNNVDVGRNFGFSITSEKYSVAPVNTMRHLAKPASSAQDDNSVIIFILNSLNKNEPLL